MGYGISSSKPNTVPLLSQVVIQRVIEYTDKINILPSEPRIAKDPRFATKLTKRNSKGSLVYNSRVDCHRRHS